MYSIMFTGLSLYYNGVVYSDYQRSVILIIINFTESECIVKNNMCGQLGKQSIGKIIKALYGLCMMYSCVSIIIDSRLLHAWYNTP